MSEHEKWLASLVTAALFILFELIVWTVVNHTYAFVILVGSVACDIYGHWRKFLSDR